MSRKYDDSLYDAQWVRDIPALLALDEVAPDLFRNRDNQRNVYRALFGGQIVAQALAAADRTVPDRTIHSLHAYFLRAGIDSEPIDYRVERLRDGGALFNPPGGGVAEGAAYPDDGGELSFAGRRV